MAGASEREHGEGAPAGERTARWAFVLGNSKYRVPHLSLANPANDAAGIAAELERIGFCVEKYQDLDRANTCAAFEEFVARAGDCDAIALYYCGHGVQLDGENYIVPTDFDPAQVVDPHGTDHRVGSLVPVERLLDWMSRARVRIVFLDACRDDGGLRRVRLVRPPDTPSSASRSGVITAGTATRSMSAEPGLGRMRLERHPQTLICFASEPGSVAQDGAPGGLSPFSKAVAEEIAIRGLDVFLLAQRVAQKVRTVTQNAQTPWTNAFLTERFSFHPADNTPIFYLMAMAALTGLLGAILSFDLFASFWPLIVKEPDLIDSTKDHTRLFLPLMFGSVLASAAYFWGKKRWYVPLATLAIYWPVAAFSRWWLALYKPDEIVLRQISTLTWDDFLAGGLPPDILKLVLISILASALAGAATVFCGAPFSRDLARLPRILTGAVIGALGAAFFLAFLWGRALINEFLHRYAAEATAQGYFLWLESVFVILLMMLWEMLLAYNVGRAYAKPSYD